MLARKAAEYAISLSANLDAEYILLHCDTNLRPTYSFINKLDDIITAEAMQTTEALAESIKESTGLSPKITCDFLFGDPVNELDSYSQKNGVDLIIMGTKGDGRGQESTFRVCRFRCP